MKKRIVEWSEKPWNPTTGCTPYSRGCQNCYAERQVKWLQRMKNQRYNNGFNLTLHPDVLQYPFGWRKPKRVLVGSMSDLFHNDVPLDYIKRVFEVICENPQHLFMVVTKRAEVLHGYHSQLPWPRNLLMAVSVEHSDYKNRIRLLQDTGALNKVVFFEPLLGEIGVVDLTGIKWAFIGGESGPRSRVMQREWVLNLKEQCEKYNCTFIFKQWGGYHRSNDGCELDGRRYDNIPTVENCLREPSLFW